MNTFDKIAVPGVCQLQPYQPGKPIEDLERELGLSHIVKLASNENPLGPSPKVVQAFAGGPIEIERYPDGNGHRLKATLAEILNVQAQQITLGNGSSDLLDIIARVFLQPGSEAMFSQHAFAMYPIVTQAVGAKACVVPALDRENPMPLGHDLAAFERSINEDTRLIFIANPNNPTGTYLAINELEAFLSNLPENIVCVVDEAYFEYVGQPDYPNSMEWVARFPNLIVTRTFSKAYGLAGMRIGYCVSCIEIADLLNRIRQPFNCNSHALIAAEVALQDEVHVKKSIDINAQGLVYLTEAMQARGILVLPSVGNFVCIDLKRPAEPVYQSLLRSGVIVRPIGNYELPHHLRVTVGTHQDNAFFIGALDRALSND